jgi:hypothetical protein
MVLKKIMLILLLINVNRNAVLKKRDGHCHIFFMAAGKFSKGNWTAAGPC